MTQKQVKILRSVGTASGVFNQGAEPHVNEAIADSWVEAGFAKYIEESKPVDLPVDLTKIETPESNVPPVELQDGEQINNETLEDEQPKNETPEDEQADIETPADVKTKKPRSPKAGK